MKEQTLRKKIVDKLNKEGYVTCTIAGSRFGSCVIRNKEGKVLRGDDIFTIWDGVFWKGKEMRFLQWTTTPNRASHRKKILAFFKENDVSAKVELWSYDVKKREFVIEIIE